MTGTEPAHTGSHQPKVKIRTARWTSQSRAAFQALRANDNALCLEEIKKNLNDPHLPQWRLMLDAALAAKAAWGEPESLHYLNLATLAYNNVNKAAADGHDEDVVSYTRLASPIIQRLVECREKDRIAKSIKAPESAATAEDSSKPSESKGASGAGKTRKVSGSGDAGKTRARRSLGTGIDGILDNYTAQKSDSEDEILFTGRKITQQPTAKEVESLEDWDIVERVEKLMQVKDSEWSEGI